VKGFIFPFIAGKCDDPGLKAGFSIEQAFHLPIQLCGGLRGVNDSIPGTSDDASAAPPAEILVDRYFSFPTDDRVERTTLCAQPAFPGGISPATPLIDVGDNLISLATHPEEFPSAQFLIQSHGPQSQSIPGDGLGGNGPVDLSPHQTLDPFCCLRGREGRVELLQCLDDRCLPDGNSNLFAPVCQP
jgi:hypothetical protein